MPCFSAEDTAGAQDGPAAAVIFEEPASDRLLEEVEVCRAQLPLLRDLVDKDQQLDEIRVEREALLRERIGFLEKQQGELLRMNDQALKQADLARKAGGGSWWEQLLTAGKWVGLGIALGFVGGRGGNRSTVTPGGSGAKASPGGAWVSRRENMSNPGAMTWWKSRPSERWS